MSRRDVSGGGRLERKDPEGVGEGQTSGKGSGRAEKDGDKIHKR